MQPISQLLGNLQAPQTNDGRLETKQRVTVSLGPDGRVIVSGPEPARSQAVLALRPRVDEVRAFLTPNRCDDCGANAGSGVRCSGCAAALICKSSGGEEAGSMRVATGARSRDGRPCRSSGFWTKRVHRPGRACGKRGSSR